MASERSAFRQEYERLKAHGFLLKLAMADDLDRLSDAVLEDLREKKIELPSFKGEYDAWYSVALELIRQVLPDRLEDFRSQYKNDRRKEIDYLTYTISDYLIGLRTTFGGEVKVEGSAAYPKLERQLSILDAVDKALDSKLVDIEGVLQADLFDSELDASRVLGDRGFYRGGGAVAGVVLERHLAHVCGVHSLKTRKKNPAITDLNQMLRDAGVIDTPKWRFIQHLGDLRNLCDHPKEREPTKNDVFELIEGVRKITRTIA